MKIEVGDIVELHNGEVHKVDRMLGNDPDHMNAFGDGPFVIDGLRYHKDGRRAYYGFAHTLSVKRIISRASDDTPKLWRDMTDEEKGALLLAHYEGKVIEWNAKSAVTGKWGFWYKCDDDCLWDGIFAYRIKPEPVRETMTGYYDATHRITFDLIDGEPDCEKCPTCGSAKHVNMEKV